MIVENEYEAATTTKLPVDGEKTFSRRNVDIRLWRRTPINNIRRS
jgi:hypothetical protein